MKPDISFFDAVIFDMDGVLIDSEPLWKIAMEEVFSSHGSKLTKQDFQRTVGLRIDEVIAYWHKHEGWKDVSPETVEKEIVMKMVELIRENAQPLPGVVETLDHLRNSGKKVGLATSSYEILIQTVLRELNIADYFDFTHSAEHEAYGKPHPAVYLTVANSLGIDPVRCLVVEDSLNGIISAKAARMKVVCIPEKTHFPEPKLSLADYRYDSMSDLLKDWKNS
jgi:mannitol-1-/sugar-/sorbitol-6-/2-deoxyglucose-6-phosphatase